MLFTSSYKCDVGTKLALTSGVCADHRLQSIFDQNLLRVIIAVMNYGKCSILIIAG